MVICANAQDVRPKLCDGCNGSARFIRRASVTHSIPRCVNKFRKAFRPPGQRGGTGGQRSPQLRPVLLLFAAARIVQLEIVQSKARVVQNNQAQNNLDQRSGIVGELADLHVATLASANPVDVVSSDRHNVKPWFAGKIPFNFDLPELRGSQFELIGGRVTYMEQSPGAQLLFRVRKHQISVFIFQTRALPVNFARAGELDARSFHLESWQRGGLQYFVIGDVAPEDLRALGDLLEK